MKKALSIFLAALMLVSVMAVSAYALEDILYPDIREPGVCTCEDHDWNNPCRCCIYCKNLDTTYKLDCCNKEILNGEEVWTFCCPVCDGMWDCDCVGCECCENKKSEDQSDNDGTQILPSNVQNSFIKSFQNAINKIKDVFDNFFDRIFEFLKIEDFFGN